MTAMLASHDSPRLSLGCGTREQEYWCEVVSQEHQIGKRGLSMIDGNQAKNIILESMPDDWFVSHSSIRDDGSEGGHYSFATYMRDPRLSMKWGREVVSPFRTDWTEKAFGESQCSSFLWVGEVYGNAIKSEVLLSADGGNLVLPLPVTGSMTVTTESVQLSQLIHDLDSTGASFRSGVTQAGLELPSWFTDGNRGD